MTEQKHTPPPRQIRALFDENNIRVYQAYSNGIADSAITNGRFVSPPFKMTRMTWIKPSFLWMMYRAGWGLKDAGQERILAIDIRRDGFEWALANSCLSHPDEAVAAEEWEELKARSPVRIQWDPERNLELEPLPYRAIQIGLSGLAVHLYVNEWTTQISDVTELAHRIHEHVRNRALETAALLLPKEAPYPFAETATPWLLSHK